MSVPAAPPRWTLPALVLLAVVTRGICWTNTSVMMNDGADFIWQAERILDGDWRSAVAHDYHPGYGAAIAAVSPLFARLDDAAAAISILGGALLVLGAWWMGRLVLPDAPWAPFATALVAAVHARLITMAADVQPEGLYLGLFGLAGAVAWSGPTSRRPALRFAAAGLLVGLAYLCRQQALLLGLPVLLWWAGGGRAPKPRLSGLIAFGAGVLVGVLPYVLAIHELTGAWAMSMKPSMSAFSLDEAPTRHRPGLETAPLYRTTVPSLHRRPRRTPDAAGPDEAPDPEEDRPAPREGSLVLLRLPDEVLPQLWSPLEKSLRMLRLDGLLLLGFGLAWLRRRRPGALAVWGLSCAAYMLVLSRHVARWGFLSDRHVMSVIVMSLPLLGAGLLHMWSGAWRARARPATRRTVRVLAGLALATMLQRGTYERREAHDARLTALAWVREHVPPDHAIGVRRRRDTFYAQRPVLIVNFPCRLETLLERMRWTDTDCLVLDESHVDENMAGWIEDGIFTVRARFEGTHARDEPVVILEPGPAAPP